MAELLQLGGAMFAHRSLTTGLLGMACCIGLFWQVRGEPLPGALLRERALAAEAAAAPSAMSAGPCSLEQELASAPRAPAVNVVDVAAAAATPALVAQLIGVGEGERVTAVDEHPVASDLEAGTWIAARLQRPPAGSGVPFVHPRRARGGDYLDVTIAHAGGSRRVLVLLH